MFSQSSNYFKYFLELLNADPTDGIDNLNHMEFMNHYMESLWKLFSLKMNCVLKTRMLITHVQNMMNFYFLITKLLTQDKAKTHFHLLIQLAELLVR